MNNAEGVPCDRFFAMTMLDENRAKTQLAQKAGVDVTEVTNMTIWGNHSATQYPDAYSALISSKSAAEVTGDEAWLKTASFLRCKHVAPPSSRHAVLHPQLLRPTALSIPFTH